MFTGLVEEIGTISKINMGAKSGTIFIDADKILKGTKVGDSICVNGVCLTATSVNNGMFSADVMAETFRRSSLGSLNRGSHVNLERAMAADGRFGGHIVSGHIDGTGTIESVKPEENAIWYTIKAPKEILDFIVMKGSIAIDGISLTVAYIDDSVFKVSIIPHTAKETILQFKKAGDIVNLENDVVGKYVEKLLFNRERDDRSNSGRIKDKKSGITMEFLAKNGF
ncbi:MAG: riboflavin synthase [Lachnospiraceae bacterium]|nr:riboflavin synthase [Lachnospiraceae bacterium]